MTHTFREIFSLRQSFSKLAAFPYSGRIGRVAGTREVVVRGTYIIVYEVESGRVVILTIFHAAKNMSTH